MCDAHTHWRAILMCYVYYTFLQEKALKMANQENMYQLAEHIELYMALVRYLSDEYLFELYHTLYMSHLLYRAVRRDILLW